MDYTNVEGSFLLMNLAVLAAKRLPSPSPVKRGFSSCGNQGRGQMTTYQDLARAEQPTQFVIYKAVVPKPISFIILAVCLLGFGCDDSTTVWKAEVLSPDGSWIASARTVSGGGFGTDYLDTSVYLQQTDSSGKPFGTPLEVLGFSCNNTQVARPNVLDNIANAGGSIDLTMKWVTRSHLEVTYDKHPDLYFQVVKAEGVDVSVRDLSIQTNASQK